MRYRARLEGTSETDSGSLISLIEQWVRGGASIIVTGVLMTVDSECSVAISSLSEGECSPTQPTETDHTSSSTITTPTDLTTTVPGIPDPSVEVTANEEKGSTDKSSSSNTTTIIGGVVAIVIVLIIAITTVIVVLLLKSRCGETSLKNAEKYVSEMYIYICAHTSLLFLKLIYCPSISALCRFELTGLPSPAVVESVAIKTSSNAAYEMMKQGGEPEEGCEEVASPLRGPPPANQEVMYEVPSPPPSRDPLPAIPPPVAAAGEEEEEEEEGVYETIPGDQ